MFDEFPDSGRAVRLRSNKTVREIEKKYDGKCNGEEAGAALRHILSFLGQGFTEVNQSKNLRVQE